MRCPVAGRYLIRNGLVELLAMPANAEPVAMRYAKWAVALAVRERLLGVEHPDTLISRHSLAGAYQAAGRLVALYERTLANLERLLGAEHPDTLVA
jgi:hypothetical protein